MECRHRLDDFGGSDEDYIRTLNILLYSLVRLFLKWIDPTILPEATIFLRCNSVGKKELNAFLRGLPVSKQLGEEERRYRDSMGRKELLGDTNAIGLFSSASIT